MTRRLTLSLAALALMGADPAAANYPDPWPYVCVAVIPEQGGWPSYYCEDRPAPRRRTS